MISNLVVQKFGGTSLANIERIQAVADLIEQSVQDGKEVVAVVSAMAGETQRLIAVSYTHLTLPTTRYVLIWVVAVSLKK